MNPTSVSPIIQTTLAASASPERARVNLDRLLQVIPDPAAVLAELEADPHTLETLVAILAGSQFLTEILLRNPGYLALLSARSGLAQIKSAGRMRAEARTATDPWLMAEDGAFQGGDGERPSTPLRPVGTVSAQDAPHLHPEMRTGVARDASAALDALRRYQQRELLRIGAADLGGLVELASVTGQLSRLAESVLQTSLEIVAAKLNVAPDGFAVVAMGKLGGRELNYSSDIDLLFICAGSDGDAEDQADRCRRLGEQLIVALTQPTVEGFLYRVDMRLRPWGRVGPLAPSLAGYLRYLREHARLWEKQAFLRARPVAGDLSLGRELLSAAEPLLFAAGEDAVRREVFAMKQQTEARLRQAGRAWGEVKLGEGSIRDVEFVVQYLQLAYGGRYEELRTGHTLEAMTRLAERGLLTAGEHRILAEGYTFLRTVEHYLQILDYRQTHTLPDSPADLRYLAQRLGFAGPTAATEFVTRFDQHTAAVRAIYLRHLAGAAGRPAGSALLALHSLDAEGLSEGEIAMMLDNPDAPSPAARQHMARLAPSYAATFDPVEIERHAGMAARLDPARPVAVEAEPLGDGRSRVTVVGYDYLGVLSLICGLMFASGYSIIDGYVYTYEPSNAPEGRNGDRQRKIVDVFTVKPVASALLPGVAEHPEQAGGVAGHPERRPSLRDEAESKDAPPPLPAFPWPAYEAELLRLVRYLQENRGRVAQGELAKRVAAALRTRPADEVALPPVEIEIDNDASERYTVLQISAPDTPGFLYEFTNALALNGVHISQVFVISAGARVRDTLFVTDARGEKITRAASQRELRAATVLIKHFTHLLPRSPNPEAALIHFHEYLGELFSRPSWPDELASLERPEVLDALARLLGVSEFLWDDFLRMQYENLFPVVADVAGLGQPRSQAELREALAAAIKGGDWRDRLNEFKDREMFRIDMRHILGQTSSFAQFSAELTDLVEVVIAAAVGQVTREAQAQYGRPVDADGMPARLAVAALGKCGGRELGFASDIELMFVFSGGGETDGPRPISAAEYYEKVVVETTRAIRARREGIFQIDLQLRPYGKAGSLAVSLDAFRRYFAPGGPAWSYERQALVKLRPIAGDAALGRELEALRDAFVYTGARFDTAAMRAMRERQLRHLVEPGRINAKFSKGGLVDVEYIAQGLQMAHGHRDPVLRATNTAAAIDALAAAGIISAENAARLTEALTFLQQLINALRMVRGNSKDLTVPPVGSEEFAFLARRLGYGNDAERLSVTLNEMMGWVQRLEGRLLG